jgi:DNA-binding transcriptional regulator PaaX
MLERDKGATLTEMVEATGWQQHTTRAALTGLKKKGRAVTKDKRDGVTCYRVAKAGV